MEPAEVAEAQGQVAIRADLVPVDERAFRAVHRLEREGLLLGLDQEHVVAIVVPVAGLLPELLADQDRRADLLVTTPVLGLAHGGLKGPPQLLALGVPEGRTRADIVEAEQVQLDTEPAMVAKLGLLPAPQELVEILLRGPGGSVDPLEHRSLLVAAPIRTGHRQQLERTDLAGGRHVRAAAQVDEWPLAVEGRRRHGYTGRRRLRRQVVDDLHLERLILLREEGPCVIGRALGQDERMVGCDALGHPGLDGRQVVRGQRSWQEEVVVEPVADRRTDPELGARKQVQDRLRHHVGSGVAHGSQFVHGPRVQQLVCRAALGRLEDLLDLDRFVAHRVCLRRITEPLVQRQDERFTPAVPPAFTGIARALWGRANGRLPGRFTGRSRVVSRGSIAGLPASSRLSVDRCSARCVPIDAVFVMWWATLDSNQ